MKKNFLFVLYFICISLFCFGEAKISSNKIVDIDPFDCDNECGNVNSYKIISIDLFDALYSTKTHSLDRTKVGIKNLKITRFSENCFSLVDSECNYIYAVTFDDDVLENVVINKTIKRSKRDYSIKKKKKRF